MHGTIRRIADTRRSASAFHLAPRGQRHIGRWRSHARSWGSALLALCLAIQGLPAQNSSMRVTQPSPTASSLGKFGDVPVNLATGVPDISVPIFTVKGRTLELPVTARYHASGIRVEEVGGWLGIGWALEAGGTITRTVRGVVDEKSPNGYYQSGHVFYRPWWPTPPSSFLDSLRTEAVDGEPDQFYFNFAGRSGQFVLGPASSSTTIKDIRTIPHQKLRIVPTIVSDSITAFLIVTEDGTRYTFAASETNTDLGALTGGGPIPDHINEAYKSAWQLTEIRSPGGDVITLSYTPYPARFKIGGYQEKFNNIVVTPPGSSCVANEFIAPRKWQVVTQRLTTITAAQHTVTFVKGATFRTDALSPTNVQQEPRLDTIRVAAAHSGFVIRRFQFTHDYSTGRLTLRHIFERDGSDAQSLPPYSFDYNTATTLPAYSSMAQDHWGFYNAATTNTTLIPPAVTPAGGALPGGNRNPDSTAIKAGVLTRITYPTGGTSEFVFEANDYGALGPTLALPKVAGLRTVSVNTTGSLVPVDSAFTVVGPDTALATVSVYLQPSTCGGVGCRYATILHKGMWTTGGTYSLALPPGLDTAEVSNEGDSNAFASISVTWPDSVAAKKKVAGGLRLAELRTTDAMGTTRIRKYRYTLQADAARSSGVMDIEPRYAFQFNGPFCRYFSRASQAATPLGGGPIVGYREVTVWDGANGEYGVTRSTYRSVADVRDDSVPVRFTKWPYFKRTSREYKRGQQTSVTMMSNTSVVQQRQGTAYVFRDDTLSDTVSTRRYRGMSIHEFSSSYYGATGSYNTFETVSAWQYPVADTTVVYDTLGANGVTTVASYAYANPRHLQRTQTTETNSNGTQRITNIRYPADYATGSGNVEAAALTAMQDTIHMPAAEIERWVIQRSGGVDSVVQGRLTTYKLFAANTTKYLPFQRFVLSSPAPLAAASFTPSAVTSGSFTRDTRYIPEETATNVDAYGRVTSWYDGRGQVTGYSYGASPNDAYLKQIVRVHDATGSVDLVTDIGHGSDGLVSSVTTEGRANTYFAYDLWGRLKIVWNHFHVQTKGYGYLYSRTSPGWTFNAASPNTVADTTYLQPGTGVVTTQVLDGLGQEI